MNNKTKILNTSHYIKILNAKIKILNAKIKFWILKSNSEY